ncbi:MAG: rRNA maturation RNase YbeY [Chitinophagales bacterium]|nr:rRNA maturation RNase YbeY [Chitinophagales bacterium]
MAINFYFDEVQKPKDFKTRRFKVWLSSIEKYYQTKIDDLSYIFVNDEQLLAINQKYLAHDTYTDIITFDLSEIEKHINGEIYISLDRILDNAQKFNVPILDELLRVIAHGLLHLIGYDDKTKAKKTIMTEQENICIQLYHSIIIEKKIT